MRVKKTKADYARAASGGGGGAAAAACVCALCSTAVMRRLSIHATGAPCVRRAWGVLYEVRGAPKSPEPRARLLSSLTARGPRQHAVVVDKARGGVIDVESTPC